jgi:tetratricopeptide (TPR) repeat protein
VNADWEARVDQTWASNACVPDDETAETQFRARVDRLVEELPAGSAIGLFERACAWDSTGHSDRAVPLYRRALEIGLSGLRRRRAVIQLASSLRNLGHAEESVALLTAELDAGSDDLDDAVRAFLALALTSVGRDREAVSVALTALAAHLPRYNRSLAAYARELT